MTIILYLIVGVLTGVLATMFGFGGGFVAVPVLFCVLSKQGYHPGVVMHVAVGTSLMLMFVNMLYASYLHYKKGNIDISLFKKMFLFMIIGATFGSCLANVLNANELRYVFIGLVFLVLLKNLHQEFIPRKIHVRTHPPSNKIIKIISLMTGFIGSLLGIGGSVIIVPFCRHHGISMPKASGLANALAVPGALIGSVIFVIAGYQVMRLPPHSLGYIYWPALIYIFAGSLVGSKVGILFSKYISDYIYGKIYCLLLVIVILSMVFPAS